MNIGRNKVLAALGASIALVAALVAWWAGGSTGLLVVILLLSVLSTAALGALVAVSERRVRRLMTEHHRGETRLIEALQRDATETKDRLAAFGHPGKQAEALLTSVQAGFARLDHETRKRDEELSATMSQALHRELFVVVRRVETIAREIDVSRRELAIVDRGLTAATERLDSTVGDVAALAATTRTAYDDLRSSVLEELTRRSRNEVVTNFRRLVDEAVSEFDSLQRLHERFPVEGSPPALGGWAIGPGAMLYILDLVEANNVSLVVECGPGASTVYLAELFRRRGHGRVVSVEHDEWFFAHVTDDLAQRGLAPFADVRFSPLVDVDVGGGTQLWYDPSTLADIADIELLLVDGPPQATGKLARYPAVPLLADRLVPAATVVVDDAHRPGEQAAMARWRNELGWEPMITPPGGFAALTRRASDAEVATDPTIVTDHNISDSSSDDGPDGLPDERVSTEAEDWATGNHG